MLLTNYEKGYIICLEITLRGNTEEVKNVFENLSNTLKAEGITQKEYGNLLGITEKSVTNKINGTTEFTYSEFKKTALLLRKYKETMQQAKYDKCKGCMKTFHYENIVVPELQSEIEYWKKAYSNEQLYNSLMQKEIAKLRIGREAEG